MKLFCRRESSCVLQIIQRAAERETLWINLARHYETEFLEDMDFLRVRPPTVITRVSEHISEIVEYVEKIKRRYE